MLLLLPACPQHSYVEYNNPGASEEEIQTYARSVTYGLFSVLATMGSVPVIRCAPGGPAEMASTPHNDWSDQGHAFTPGGTFFLLPEWKFVVASETAAVLTRRACVDGWWVLVQQVAQQLNSLVSDHLMQGSSTFFSSSAASGAASASSFHRPLLILIDRNEDLITSLHHTSTYQVRSAGFLRRGRLAGMYLWFRLLFLGEP